MTLVILDVLRESPLPIRTADLTAICAGGRTNPHGQVWSILSQLRRAGVVRGTNRRTAREGGHETVWTLARAG